jgi:hypothetical protein
VSRRRGFVLICRYRGYVADVAVVADLPGDSGDSPTSGDIGAGVAGTSARLRHDIGADVAEMTGRLIASYFWPSSQGSS